MFVHAPVLPAEVLQLLEIRPGDVVVDGTLGGGGHSGLLLDAGATVIGLDRDPVALKAASARLSGHGARFTPVLGNFRDVAAVLSRLGIPHVDGALVDLGVSSPQLDDAGRGFSFRGAGPLDMRMGPDAERLDEYLARVSEADLAHVISVYGEERFARPIARAVKRELPGIADTARLSEVVASAIPRKAWPDRIHPATRTFQALRIAVNDELGALEAWLRDVPGVLRPASEGVRGGRAAAIAFHSLEDRAVKQAFAALTVTCSCPPDLPVCICRKAPFRAVTRKAIKASDTEIEANPRARSARLRAVERL